MQARRSRRVWSRRRTSCEVRESRIRVYVVPGTPTNPETAAILHDDAERARQRLEPDQSETLDLVVAILLGEPVGSEGLSESPERAEAVIRFQQVCGAVTAKGVEDTALLPLDPI